MSLLFSNRLNNPGLPQSRFPEHDAAGNFCGHGPIAGACSGLTTSSPAWLIEERRKRDVFSVRPGITGSAQLAGIDMLEPERLAIADRAYIDQKSFIGDLAILISTALGKGSGDAAKG